MVELFSENRKLDGRQSSKGNQLKWFDDTFWYKADFTGYEGLAEYMVSALLKYCNLQSEDYVLYDTEEIMYESARYLGCKSKSFLPEGWQLITLERLFYNFYGESLYKSIYKIENLENRVTFLVEQVERITGLKEFGKYMSKLLTIDALFLNEDRHTHNMAVLLDTKGEYHYCPIFDNGGALLSDTTMDYPMSGDIYTLLDKVKSKTFCQDFDEQLDVVERLCGQHLQFTFDRKVIADLLDKESYYPEEIKTRVEKILLNQRRKYEYLF
ncbi:MAG: hypothetical protein J6B90_09000 [Lachnospiraceae bacterium]|nr:hypothetical protein [Lachnospiraceae bacterium]